MFFFSLVRSKRCRTSKQPHDILDKTESTPLKLIRRTPDRQLKVPL